MTRLPVQLSSNQSWPGDDQSAPSLDATGLQFAAIFKGEVTGAEITSVTIVGSYRAIETSKKAVVSDVKIDGLTANVLRECIRVIGNRITIRNTHCSQFDGPRTKRGDLPEGVHVQAGSDILIERSSFNGFQMTSAGNKYWNGDGIAAERPVSGLVIRDVVADNNTDAGFDIKPAVEMDRVSASGNCRNFRFWTSANVGTMTIGNTVRRGGNSHCSGLWLQGAKQDQPELPLITIKKLIVRATTPIDLLEIDGAVKLTIGKCDLPSSLRLSDVQVPPGSDVSLGKGCEALRRVLVFSGKPKSDRQPAQKAAAEIATPVPRRR